MTYEMQGKRVAFVSANEGAFQHLTPGGGSVLRNAGAEWQDAEVVVSTQGPNTLISSRKPDDLPAFDEKLVEVFAQQGQ